MGCDIHAFCEQLDDNLTWQVQDLRPDAHIEEYFEKYELHIPRDYRLFGLLTMGTRGISYPESFAQRELPPVMSEQVKTHATQWELDAHTHSYLLRSELEAKQVELVLMADESLNALSGLKDLLSKLPEPPKGDKSRQRVVFWFDN